MKISLAYPKIPDSLDCPLNICHAFEKYDGTCFAFYWSPEYGWTDFGTRRDKFAFNEHGFQQFNQIHPELSKAYDFWDFDNKLANYLSSYSKSDIVIFAEYFGDNSFAGSHEANDPKQFIIFDIQKDNALISPEELIVNFRDFNIAKLLYKGKFTGQLFIDVRTGKYLVKEGVVVKGLYNDKIYMAKIKTNAYLVKLKNKFPDKWKEHWE